MLAEILHRRQNIPAGVPKPKLGAAEEAAEAGVDKDRLTDELDPAPVLKLKGAPELLLAVLEAPSPPNPEAEKD